MMETHTTIKGYYEGANAILNELVEEQGNASHMASYRAIKTLEDLTGKNIEDIPMHANAVVIQTLQGSDGIYTESWDVVSVRRYGRALVKKVEDALSAFTSEPNGKAYLKKLGIEKPLSDATLKEWEAYHKAIQGVLDTLQAIHS